MIHGLINTKLEVSAPDVLHKLCFVLEFRLSWLLKHLFLDVVHGSLVERDELIRHLLLVLDLEVGGVVDSSSIFLTLDISGVSVFNLTVPK